MRHRARRIALATIEAFLGLCAVGGGLAILTNAFNFNQWLPVEWLQGTPFSDYTIPGLLLLIVIGEGMLLAAATIFVQREWAVLFSMAMGLVMIGFEIFEVAIIDRFGVIPGTMVQQVLMSGLGLVIFGLAFSLWMSEYREHHFPVKHIRHA